MAGDRPRFWRETDWVAAPTRHARLLSRSFADSRLALAPRSFEPAVRTDSSPRQRRSWRSLSPRRLDQEVRLGLVRDLVGGAWRAPYPSAGALYPCHPFLIEPWEEPFATVTYVDGARGLLIETHRVESDTVKEAVFEDWAWPVGCMAVIAVDFARVLTAYGDRGHRFALIEAGIVAERLLVSAERLGLGACLLGGYNDLSLLACLRMSSKWFGVAIAAAIGARRG